MVKKRGEGGHSLKKGWVGGMGSEGEENGCGGRL